MKKFLLVLGILIFVLNSCHAASCRWVDCVEPYDLSAGISRFMSNVTGSNFLGVQVAQAIFKKELRKTMDGKLSINIDSYSVKDLKKGIFKSIKLKGRR